MSRSKRLLAAAAGAVLMTSAARGSIACVGLQQVPISVNALAADPTLANYTSYDLMVSISPGDHWAAASIIGTLPTGNFYVPATFDADTGLQTIAAFVPNLNNDTFVSRPGYADPGSGAVLGSGSGAPAPLMPKSSNNKNAVDVAWGDVNASSNNLSGVQAIARLTISNSLFGGGAGPAFMPPSPYAALRGVLKSTSDPNAENAYALIVFPEPSSLALVDAVLCAIAIRRRR
jgi:hypothetical protein